MIEFNGISQHRHACRFSSSRKSWMFETGADFGGGDATKHFSVKDKDSSVKRGEDFFYFYRNGSSMKRSGPFSEPLDSEN